MNVRLLHGHEVEKALLLIREVFLQTESRGLSQRAVDSFLNMQTRDAFLQILSDEKTVFLGAFDEELDLVGVLCAEGFFLTHLYVKRRGKGIGKALYTFYEEILISRMEEGEVIRLNATLSSVPFYEALGFTLKEEVQEIYGISFVPMEKKLKKDLY
ncbi:GNAT family N-acetyltransferase [Proteiniclasticum ruminis]|uniref:Acetyltransferase (GNAT) family protein n=1 Tax=Proteiniclasticum ruminis TaxID=398199 RepID=A0A1I5AS59_9CLOT|nr:GNAT family N-acetyltransferase [Proteiniclasticum ruminis]SFN65263.1 Acetyltransferase (GNAT) family protein [Proteiniclasticum ruminis]